MNNYIEPGQYILTNKATGTVLDLSGSDSKSIIGWQHNGGSNQNWDILPVQDDTYMIASAAGGKRITAPDGGDRPIAALADPNDPRSLWRAFTNDGFGYIFHNMADPGKVLDLAASSPDNGTPIVLWEPNGGANQEWIIRRIW
ncbi:uncharacterized protein ATNIH1004_003015 [Aspergillus tanneri]|uniref:Ricin B lectin domain-containing protein n=1 Tax=Aspergillus tanneri TaxID=1220188 RepID=A0A5M9MT89_9EURO|nr:uncharacterized protein ATNIH1004_003015 [Aspergillus tanneri]KAA8650331.1 hypothetical protein ATNIH1004_003015 [Aspergillus tanneri]